VGPGADVFDGCFTQVAESAGLRRLWAVVAPGMPAEVEPYSFVSPAMLAAIGRELRLAAGERLVDLACGRGGPGLWLARQAGALLTGVDFAAVAVAQAGERAALFGLAGRAGFRLGELTATGLPDAYADAVVCVDAMHFVDLAAGVREARRILAPGRRLVLTNWQPRTPGDQRLAAHRRDRDWARTLREAGFVDVTVDARSDWHEFYTRLYRAALDLGEPGQDAALAAMQAEARAALTYADLLDRVLVSATRPVGGR
jgi:SAM-dependent methyltransferase